MLGALAEDLVGLPVPISGGVPQLFNSIPKGLAPSSELHRKSHLLMRAYIYTETHIRSKKD